MKNLYIRGRPKYICYLEKKIEREEMLFKEKSKLISDEKG